MPVARFGVQIELEIDLIFEGWICCEVYISIVNQVSKTSSVVEVSNSGCPGRVTLRLVIP